MTREKFDNTSFSKGMRAETKNGLRLEIIVVDFEERMIGTDDALRTKYNPIRWFHCEDVEIVIEKRLQQ